MFGMYPKKGTIAVGSDADIVIYDPDGSFVYSADTIHMNIDYTAYDGVRIGGGVDMTMSRGKVVVNKGEYVGVKGDGHYLRRGTSQYVI